MLIRLSFISCWISLCITLLVNCFIALRLIKKKENDSRLLLSCLSIFYSFLYIFCYLLVWVVSLFVDSKIL